MLTLPVLLHVLVIAPLQTPAESAEPTPGVSSTPATPATGGAIAPETRPSAGPFALGLDVGVDIPVAGLPMASARAEGGLRVPLAGPFIAGVGLRSGYSYVAGEGVVVDALRGTEPHGFWMVHRIPIRAALKLGVSSDDVALFGVPVEAGLIASAGPDVAISRAHSFGRTVDTVDVVAGAALGGYLLLDLGVVHVGALGELDAARAPLGARAPGVSGDLTATRISLLTSFPFGG